MPYLDHMILLTSLMSRARGAVFAESWTAIPYKDFLGLIKELD